MFRSYIAYLSYPFHFSWFLSLFIFIFLVVYIYSYMYTLGHLFPRMHPHPLTYRQNLFHPFLQFCWRENIRDNKKDIAFLLVWDKDSYTEKESYTSIASMHMCYNLKLFISTRPLHYFLVTFPKWPLTV
jgi:hypothetical protein